MEPSSSDVFIQIERPRSLPNEIVRSVMAAIDSGRIKPGDRLPTEQDLAKKFGVARTVVREAIALLKHDGIVLARQGIGAFVTSPVQRRAFRVSPACFEKRKALLKLLQLQATVHADAAALAAENRSEKQLSELDALLREITYLILEDRNKAEQLAKNEQALYLMIAQSTGNEYFVQFISLIDNHVVDTLWSAAVKNAKASEQCEAALAEHQSVIKAIKEQNPEAARIATKVHFEHAAQRLADRADFADGD